VTEVDTREAPRPDPRTGGAVLTDGAARVVDVVRWVLVAVLIADVLCGLLTVPRDATLSDYRRDLADGRVRSVSVLDAGSLRSGAVLTGHHPGGGEPEPVLLWRVGPLGYRVAHLPQGGSDLPRTSGLADSQRDLLMHWDRAGTAVLVVLVLVVVLGPQPRRMTKWALFWALLLPLNLGMIWALRREAPWSPEARAWPEPAPHRWQPADRRRTGGETFVWLLLAAVAGKVVLSSLQQHTW
jgi:hypothetical protein